MDGTAEQGRMKALQKAKGGGKREYLCGDACEQGVGFTQGEVVRCADYYYYYFKKSPVGSVPSASVPFGWFIITLYPHRTEKQGDSF